MDSNSDNKFKGISRRNFCKTTSMAAGGAFLSTLPIGASAYVAPNETLNIAVIGCGGRGTGAVNNVLSTGDGVKLVAMADAFEDRLEDSYSDLMGRYEGTGKIEVPDDHKFVGFEAYKHAIELADVVLLCAPPGFRPRHFEEAVRQGKHIFAEKPIATDIPGLRRFLDAVESSKEKELNVVVGLQRHYETKYREVSKRIHDGAIGDVISGQVYWNSAGVWVRERQPDQTEMEYQMRNWYYFNWLSGDHILEQHIHNIDVANWFIGEYPTSAQGMGGRQVRTGKEYGEIFDHHFVEFTYPGGAIISSQCRHQENTMQRVTENLQGTRGTVETGPGRIRHYNGYLVYDHDDEGDPNPYQQEIDELIAAIRNGKVINDGDNAANSNLSAIMGRMATYSGQVIDREEAINSGLSLMPERLAWDAEPPVMPDEDGYYPVPTPGQTRVL